MKNIALIGFMGSGKSTIGPLLADLLGWSFVDLDSKTEELAGEHVAEIFERGEAHWRRFEGQALASAARLDRVVLACGGGIILGPENRELLRKAFLTIYLQAGSETLFERVRDTRARPLLNVPDPKAAVVKLYGERRELYEAVAHTIVSTENRPPADIAAEAAAAVKVLEIPE